jgi:hypothetical protein
MVRMSIFSTDTGDCSTDSSTREAATTTSLAMMTCSASSMRRALSLPFTITSWVAYPTADTTRANGGGVFVVREKLPRVSVVVPVTLPFTSRFTPGMGSLVPASVMVPATVMLWARRAPAKSKRTTAMNPPRLVKKCIVICKIMGLRDWFMIALQDMFYMN